MEEEGEAKLTCVVSNHSAPLPSACCMKRIFSWESEGNKRVEDGQQQGETSLYLLPRWGRILATAILAG
jgi:hypothetical protein